MHGKAEVVGVEFVELSQERQIQIMRRTAEAWVKRRGDVGWRLQFVSTEEARQKLRRAGWLPVLNVPTAEAWRAEQQQRRLSQALLTQGRWAIRQVGPQYRLFRADVVGELPLEVHELAEVGWLLVAALEMVNGRQRAAVKQAVGDAEPALRQAARLLVTQLIDSQRLALWEALQAEAQAEVIALNRGDDASS